MILQTDKMPEIYPKRQKRVVNSTKFNALGKHTVKLVFYFFFQKKFTP